MSSIQVKIADIETLESDCVVNAANSKLKAGSGVCGSIFKAAGSDELAAACSLIGGCRTGSAVITPGFSLKAKFIIHAVGPRYTDGKSGEDKLLYSAYYSSLELAMANGLHSIGFPLISAGVYGYPADEVWEIAVRACRDFIGAHPEYDTDIIFAVRNESAAAAGNAEIKKQSLNGMPKPSPVFLGGNKAIEDAICDWYFAGRVYYPARVYDIIGQGMKNRMEVLVALKTAADSGRGTFTVQYLSDNSGNWLPVFTNPSEIEKGERTSMAPQLLSDMLELAVSSGDYKGVVINPFGESLCLDIDVCGSLLEMIRLKTRDELDLDIGSAAYRAGDYARAVEYYTRSADAGNVTALSNLGYCCYYGRSMPADKARARECWERAAILGDISSVYKLGDMYRNGDLEVQTEFSHALYRRAFELAQYCGDINVFPDAYLRMLRYYPEEIKDIEHIAQACADGFRERIAHGDTYSDKMAVEAEAYRKKYCRRVIED